MVLATHTIVGGALGRILPGEPAVVLLLGFISHFVLDTIPHWDYPMRSLNEDRSKPLDTTISLNKDFLIDLLKLGADVAVGLIVTYLAFGLGQSPMQLLAVAAGSFGALLPDFLQFVYFRFKREPLVSLQRFHNWIHATTRLDDRPGLGVFLQTSFVVLIIAGTKTFLESKAAIILPEIISSFTLTDALDILVVSVALYLILLFVKETKSFLIANTVILLAALYYVAEHFNLSLVRQLFQPFLAFIIVIFAIVFQRELRRFFEWFSVSGRNFARGRVALSSTTIDFIIRAVRAMAEQKTGALIIIPGEHPLDQIIEGGYVLDGRVSAPLLLSIFDSSSPGHDGAVLIEGNRIRRFGLHLPLADNFDRTLGTRHRAAMGLTERTDALVIVVSEERGVISLAKDGQLVELSQPEELASIISEHLPDNDNDALEYFLIRNFWWKLSALALALLLWFVFVFQTGTIRREISVPVAFRFVPAGYIVSNLNVDKITLTVSGPQSDLLALSSDSLTATFDLSSSLPGSGQLPVTAKVINLPSYLQVENLKPSTLRFNLLPDKTRP